MMRLVQSRPWMKLPLLQNLKTVLLEVVLFIHRRPSACKNIALDMIPVLGQTLGKPVVANCFLNVSTFHITVVQVQAT